MNLRQKKIKSRSFKHYLETQNLPSALSDSELKVVLADMMEGNLAARDRLIMSYVGLAMSIVGRYLTVLKSGMYTDDLVGAALLALTEEANQVMIGDPLGPDFNIGAAFTDAIHNEISRCLDNVKLIRIPQITQRKRIKAGKEPIPEPQFLEYNVVEGKSVNYSDESLSRQGWWKVWKAAIQKPRTEVMDDKLIMKIISNEFEKSVFDLRISSPTPMSDREIAEKLKVSHVKVWLARKAIGERLKKEIKQ